MRFYTLLLGPCVLARTVAAQPPGPPSREPQLFGRPLREWVQEALGDTTLRIRVRARLALSRSGPLGRDAAELIIPFLTRTSGEARLRALFALEGLSQYAEPAVPAIAAILDDPSADSRAEALDVLAAIGPHAGAALPAVQRFLERRDDPALPNALLALARISPATAVSSVERFLRDPSPELREAAIDALAVTDSAARSSLPVLVTLQLDSVASVARAAARLSTRLLSVPPLEWHMLAEIRGSSRSLQSDGKGPYIDRVDGVRSMRRQSLGLNTKACTGTCDTETSMVPIGGPDKRFLVFDLSRPLAGAKSLGRVVDAEAVVFVFWRHDHGRRIHWIRDMPVADTLQPIERVEFRLRIARRPYILQFGEWAVGEFNTRAPRITGEGTTSSLTLHPTSGEWLVRSATRSVGRLWDVSDPDHPVNRGLYLFSFELRFVDLPSSPS